MKIICVLLCKNHNFLQRQPVAQLLYNQDDLAKSRLRSGVFHTYRICFLNTQQISYIRQTKQLPNHELICKRSPNKCWTSSCHLPRHSASHNKYSGLTPMHHVRCQMNVHLLSKDIASKSRQYYPIPYHFQFFNFHITTRQAADITLILIRIQNKSSATYFTSRMFLLQSTLWSDQSSCHSYHRGPISKGHMESVQGYNPWEIQDGWDTL